MFQASSPIQQLELITDLLGTPSLSDMKYACEAAKRHMLSRGCKPPTVTACHVWAGRLPRGGDPNLAHGDSQS